MNGAAKMNDAARKNGAAWILSPTMLWGGGVLFCTLIQGAFWFGGKVFWCEDTRNLMENHQIRNNNVMRNWIDARFQDMNTTTNEKFCKDSERSRASHVTRGNKSTRG